MKKVILGLGIILASLPTLALEYCLSESYRGGPCRPPQYINVSFDGNYNLDLWNELIDFGNQNHAKFTFFISGVTYLHQDIRDSSNPFSRNQYETPKIKKRGHSRVLFARDGMASTASAKTLAFYENYGLNKHSSLSQIQTRYLTGLRAVYDGHELGTHGNGHYYGGAPEGGIPSYSNASESQKKYKAYALDWSEEDWTYEFSQFFKFAFDNAELAGIEEVFKNVFSRKTELSPIMDLRNVVGSVKSSVKGMRAPYLSNNESMYKALKANGMAYDSSVVSPDHRLWPHKKHGIWLYGIPMLKFPGHSKKILGMDYNMGVSNVSEESAYQAWMNSFEELYDGNRAPLNLGMHVFNIKMSKNPGAGAVYLKAMKRVLKKVCNRPEVICGTYTELTKFLNHFEDQIAQFQKSSAFVDSGVKVNSEYVHHHGDYRQLPLDCGLVHGGEIL
ncbi:MAG: hypothetical protein VX642_10650 [Bdellovibrionota bacterium]|nr:hypothetical protein [Bdellovibrionota bacterium]